MPVLASPVLAAVKALWHDQGHPVVSTGPALAWYRDSELRFSSKALVDSAHWTGPRNVLLALLRTIPGSGVRTPLKVGVTNSEHRKAVRYYKIPVTLV